jgi:sorting nexin-5/6/32
MRPKFLLQDLLYRRMRCLANYEAANKNLERSRARNKEVQKVN